MKTLVMRILCHQIIYRHAEVDYVLNTDILTHDEFDAEDEIPLINFIQHGKETKISWNDNSIVSMCVIDIRDIYIAKKIPQPHMISLYNTNMGGVDRNNQNISLYRVGIRGNKWYFSLFSHCLDLSVHNTRQSLKAKINDNKTDLD